MFPQIQNNRRFGSGGKVLSAVVLNLWETFLCSRTSGPSVLVVADAVTFPIVPAMHSSGPAPSTDANQRDGSVPCLGRRATASREPEPDAPGNAGIAFYFHSRVSNEASLS